MLTFACLVLVTINSAASFVPHIIIITADGIVSQLNLFEHVQFLVIKNPKFGCLQCYKSIVCELQEKPLVYNRNVMLRSIRDARLTPRAVWFSIPKGYLTCLKTSPILLFYFVMNSVLRWALWVCPITMTDANTSVCMLQGFNDLGFSNGGAGDSTVSQNLDRYAKSDSGTIFDKYYVMPNGHATRSALLTGKHPAHLGKLDFR